MSGILIRHATERSGLVLVPIPSRPFPLETVHECPGCHLVHLCKTVHAIVNDAGLVMVSEGVLEDLRSAPTWSEWEIVGSTDSPPPLRIGGDSRLSLLEQRAAQDKESRRIEVRR